MDFNLESFYGKKIVKYALAGNFFANIDQLQSCEIQQLNRLLQ